MAELNSARVVEVCNVAPQPSSPAGSATPPPEALPLTLFDLLWLRFAPVQRLFFYQISNSFDTHTRFKTQSLPLCRPPTIPTTSREPHMAPRLLQAHSHLCPRRRRFIYHSHSPICQSFRPYFKQQP
ncbi:hypothetical protein CerSpe_128010 [Prunus speciosa]